MKKRRNERIYVNLPVTCKLDDRHAAQPAQGRVQDLSISGMRLSLPLPLAKLRAKLLDFVLELPRPFSPIRGVGEIQWKRWDADRQCTTCGIKLSPLSLQQLTEIDAIIREVQES